ncbi:MAG TPA: hypothetical protein VLG12_05150 [Candidatus Saccharimonadales bacterium]|nr:hypothetical protein [Candidatus Saccharimonadales bacterium]
MDIQAGQQDETKVEASHLLFTFLMIVIVAILVGVGAYIGYVMGENKYKDSQAKSQNISDLITPGINPSGIQFMDGSQSSSGNASNWTIYTDVAFSIKYPTNWLVKKGFSTKDDVVVYDPKSIKQVTENGTQVRIPSAYIDILSVGAATQSAAQMFDDYKVQASNSALQSEQSPTLGPNLVLFNTGKSSANNVLWSQDGSVAQFSTSIQHLTETSTENKILQTFQFIKQ